MTRSLRRLERAADVVEDPAIVAILDEARALAGVRGKVTLLASERVKGPALAGYFRPRLLMPRELMGRLSAEELRLVFVHECSHVGRRDVLWNYVLAALTAVHWWNPVVWLMGRRIRMLRELACDEAVLGKVAEPAAYGQMLLKLMEAGVGGSTPLTVGVIEKRSFFARRIEMIARFEKSPKWVAVAAVTGLVALGACALTNAQSVPSTTNARGAAAATTTSSVFKGRVQIVGPVSTKATAGMNLDEMLEEINVEQQPLEKVLKYLRDNGDLNLVVNWAALKGMLVEQSTPVTVRLKDVPIRKVLRTALDLAAGGRGRLDFEVEDGVVVVSTVDDLAQKANQVAIDRASRDRFAAAARQYQSTVDEAQAIGGQVGGEAPNRQDTQLMNSLAEKKATWEQEKAAESSKATPDKAKMKEIDARLDVINKQIEEVKMMQAADAARKTTGQSTKVYDGLGVIGLSTDATGVLNTNQRAAMNELMHTLYPLVSSDATITSFNGMIVVKADEETQKNVQQILDLLKAKYKEQQEGRK